MYVFTCICRHLDQLALYLAQSVDIVAEVCNVTLLTVKTEDPSIFVGIEVGVTATTTTTTTTA